jgi:hypothetical protein
MIYFLLWALETELGQKRKDSFSGKITLKHNWELRGKKKNQEYIQENSTMQKKKKIYGWSLGRDTKPQGHHQEQKECKAHHLSLQLGTVAPSFT